MFPEAALPLEQAARLDVALLPDIWALCMFLAEAFQNKAALPHRQAARWRRSWRACAAEESRVDAATAEFLRAALPAAPALLLCFVCREGALLVGRAALACEPWQEVGSGTADVSPPEASRAERPCLSYLWCASRLPLLLQLSQIAWPDFEGFWHPEAVLWTCTAPAQPVCTCITSSQSAHEVPVRAQVSHELSVPAVTAMLLSALAFATAAWSGLALADALTPRARAGLQSLAALAALGVTVVVKP